MDGSCYSRKVICAATGIAAGMEWRVVLYEGEHVKIYPVGHDTDPETLSMADDARLQDLVLPADETPGYDPDPYHEQADDAYDRFKDSRAAA